MIANEESSAGSRRWTLPQAAREALPAFSPPEETRALVAEVQTAYPERVGFLVWSPDRLERLGEAVDAELERRSHAAPELRPLIRRSVLNQLTGLGPLDGLLLDDSVTEILISRFDDVMIERDGILDSVPSIFVDDQEVLTLAHRLAARSGRDLNTEAPMADARLADGSRISLVVPPVSEHPTIAIRRAGDVMMEPTELIRRQSVSTDAWEFLVRSVAMRRNIIIAGGAGSGKTHLARLLLREVSERERIVVIEDVRELNLKRQGVVSLEARGSLSTHDLIVQALRLRPDRIVVGEVRGGEALDLIEAMATGHPGSLSTVHSPGPGAATIHRIARAALRNPAAMPYAALLEEVREAIDLIVFLARDADGRRVVAAIDDVGPDHIRTLFTRAQGVLVQAADV